MGRVGKEADMEKLRDSKGRYASARALAEEANALAEKALDLVEAESQPPEWLRSLLVVIADHFGITAEEFKARVRVVHPTKADPIIMVDGKAIVSWV